MNLTINNSNSSQPPSFGARLGQGWVETLCTYGEKNGSRNPEMVDLFPLNSKKISAMKHKGGFGLEDVFIMSSKLDENNNSIVLAFPEFSKESVGRSNFVYDATKTAQEKWDDYALAIKAAINDIKVEIKSI